MGKPLTVLLTTWLNHPTSAFPEWVAHHRALGVNRFHVFLSDTLDGAQPLAAALEASGVIGTSQITFDAAESAQQARNAAIRAAELETEVSPGWGLFLGPDEYLGLARHGTVQELMADLNSPQAMTMPVWTYFGDTRERSHSPGPVLEKAVRCCPSSRVDPGARKEWRSIVKLGVWPSRVPDFPTGVPMNDLKRLRWLNGAGKPMPKPRADRTWQCDEAASEGGLAWVARVPVPSVETLLLREAYAMPPKAQAMPEDLFPVLQVAGQDLMFDQSLHKCGAARAEHLAILLEDPATRRAYDDQCEEEKKRIKVQTRKHGLWKSVLAHLEGADGTGGPGPAEGRKASPAPEKTATRREDAPRPAGSAPAGDRATQPARADAIKVHPRVPDEFARVTTDPPPPWFAEIYPGGDRQGFLTRLEHHALVSIERDPGTLIVTFDNISNVNDISYGREPWAYRFVRAGGYSHLAVIARRKDWYRDPQLIRELRKLGDDGFFDRFNKVVMAGTSMGGFAAMAFASLAPGCIVLAYSPQTTLDSELVPWEERFGMGRERNWSLPYSDAAFEIQDARRVHVIYDPFFAPDRRHIERLEGDNVMLLKSWFAGHFSAVYMRRANLIKPLFQMVIDETLTEESYYALLRGRRSLAWYRKALEERAIETGHHSLAERVGPAFRRHRRKVRKAQQAEA